MTVENFLLGFEQARRQIRTYSAFRLSPIQ